MLAERARLPEGLLEEIIESRSYARAYQANQVDQHGWQSSEMRMRAKEIEHDLAAEEITTPDG